MSSTALLGETLERRSREVVTGHELVNDRAVFGERLALDSLEQRLTHQRYLVGDRLTEAYIRSVVFTSL